MSEPGDIVAVGLDLELKTLLLAYSQGVFPWPSEGLPLLWYSPQQRAVLEFDRLHVPSRLKRFLRRQPWTYSINRAFSEVIEACSQREEEGTWIVPEMKDAYQKLHQKGHAHSVEVWENGALIGGLYGVDVGGYFAGESMFHRKSNASKAALLCAVALQKQAGRLWMDIQVLSPHLEALGACEIPKPVFIKKLESARNRLPGSESPFSERTDFDYCAFCRSIE